MDIKEVVKKSFKHAGSKRIWTKQNCQTWTCQNGHQVDYLINHCTLGAAEGLEIWAYIGMHPVHPRFRRPYIYYSHTKRFRWFYDSQKSSFTCMYFIFCCSTINVMYERIGFDLSNFFGSINEIRSFHDLAQFLRNLVISTLLGPFLGHPISLQNLFGTLTLLNVLSTTFFI